MAPALTSSEVRLPNGVRMPLLGLGTTHSGGYSHEAVVHALQHCHYRMIDTAKRYDVESLLGTAIRESEVPRERLFITSKLWPVDYGFNEAQLECRKSCQRLDTKYLDLYLLHFPEVPYWFKEPKWDVIESTWRAMEKLYDKGVCRAIGVSNFDQNDLEKLLDRCSIRPHVNQCEFHPFYNPKTIREYCRQENVLFTGYCPLAKGTILNESPIVNIAKMHSKTPAQVCIRWSIQNEVAAIPKSLKFERLMENSQVFDFHLSDCDMQILNNLHDEKCKQVILENLQEKFDLPAGYKLQKPTTTNLSNRCLILPSKLNQSALLITEKSPLKSAH